jgi:hypothetical protein
MNELLYKALEKEYLEIVTAAFESDEYLDPDETIDWKELYRFARHIQNLMHQK